MHLLRFFSMYLKILSGPLHFNIRDFFFENSDTDIARTWFCHYETSKEHRKNFWLISKQKLNTKRWKQSTNRELESELENSSLKLLHKKENTMWNF